MTVENIAGIRLRNLRLDRCISPDDIAKGIGVSRQRVDQLERMHTFPRHIAEALSKFFNVPNDTFRSKQSNRRYDGRWCEAFATRADHIEFATMIFRARLERGWKRKDANEAFGSHMCWHVEELHGRPDIKTVKKIARVLDIEWQPKRSGGDVAAEPAPETGPTGKTTGAGDS